MIKKVKISDDGWLVNFGLYDERIIPFDYDVDDEKELAEWFKENKAEPKYTDEEKIILELEQKYKNIEIYIYSVYSQSAQSQDLMWSNAYRTKLVALGQTEIEQKVVNYATLFFSGQTLENILSSVEEQIRPFYEKLVKVAIRTEWAEQAIIEGKLAIEEGREPNYMEFPDVF